MGCQNGSSSLASTLTLTTLALLLLLLLCLFRGEKVRRQVSPPPPKLESCQLNGVLSSTTGKCVCDSGWSGAECGTLKLQPVDPLKQGLRARGVSSWGGSVAWDETHDEYVMFVSVFAAGCGLNSWTRNSAIARASSATAEGPYTLQEIVKPHFAHSPQVVRNAKTGEWLLYHIGGGDNRSAEEVRGCSDGCTPLHTGWRDGLSLRVPLGVLAAQSARGPWREHVIATCDDVPGCKTHGNDANPAPMHIVHGSASSTMKSASAEDDREGVKLLWRSINKSSAGESYIALAQAASWKGPYAWGRRNLFPEHSHIHIEDGFLWRNERGYHALLHADVERTEGPGIAGVHAWSLDGVRWTLSKKNAFGRTVRVRGRHQPWRLERRERPKLLFDAVDGRPTHLITSVQKRGNICVRKSCEACDRTFTLVQPIGMDTSTTGDPGSHARRRRSPHSGVSTSIMYLG
jgi:hypothetical protein